MSEPQQQPVYKIALGIEYDGSKYYGWQRQNEVRSVQGKAGKGAVAGGGRTSTRILRRAYRRRCSRYRARWCTLKPALSVKTPRGRWA